MIPHHIYTKSLLEPTFSLNESQKSLNELIYKEGRHTIRLGKQRRVGMTTFFALFAVWEARKPETEWDEQHETLIVCPNRDHVRHVEQTIRIIHPDYNPVTNNVGIQVTSGFNYSVLCGRDLKYTNIILDELVMNESDEAEEYLKSAAPARPLRVIIAATFPKSYEVLIPELRYKGFTVFQTY